MDTLLENNRELIIQVFRGRCALNPVHPGTQIHEIIPKSLKKDWGVLGNQVLLCPECHDRIHSEGALNFKEQLQSLWRKRWEEHNSASPINKNAL